MLSFTSWCRSLLVRLNVMKFVSLGRSLKGWSSERPGTLIQSLNMSMF